MQKKPHRVPFHPSYLTREVRDPWGFYFQKNCKCTQRFASCFQSSGPWSYPWLRIPDEVSFDLWVILTAGSWAKVKGGPRGVSGQRERQPGLHGHPPTWEKRGLEAEVRPGFLCSLLRLARRVMATGGRAGGLTDMGQEVLIWPRSTTGKAVREGEEKKFFLLFFFWSFSLPNFFFSLFCHHHAFGADAMSLWIHSLYHFLFLTILQGMQDPLSSTRDWTCAPCIGAWEVPRSFPKLHLPQASG